MAAPILLAQHGDIACHLLIVATKAYQVQPALKQLLQALLLQDGPVLVHQL
jgi:ketopantoate reductase